MAAPRVPCRCDKVNIREREDIVETHESMMMVIWEISEALILIYESLAFYPQTSTNFCMAFFKCVYCEGEQSA